MRLGFSKLLGTLICGKICIYLLRIHYKKDQKKNLFDDYVIVSDFLYKGICRQVDAIQMSTRNICFKKEVKKNYTGCNLKTTEYLDCALIGVCTVIRLNTACSRGEITKNINTLWLKKAPYLELWYDYETKMIA